MSKLPYTDQTIKDEHDSVSPETKRVSLYGWNSDTMEKTRVAVNENGELKVTINE